MSQNVCFRNVQVWQQGHWKALDSFAVVDGLWTQNVPENIQVIEASHPLWIMPGLLALDVDFQEPMRDDVYRLRDGFTAMRRGGFTRAAMESAANPVDDLITLRAVQEACSDSGYLFYHLGAMSRGYHGETLSEMLELSHGGVVAFGDGRSGISSLRFLRRALEYGHMTGLRFHLLPLETSLAAQGVVHEGTFGDLLGMKSIPRQAEVIAVFQILQLAEWLQVPVHLKQLSCQESLALVAQSRERGVDVTCDVSLYHLLRHHEVLLNLNSHDFLIPPLRSQKDLEALWGGLKSGLIQAISCAHYPVLPQEKEVNFEDAIPGAVSLEVALPALLQGAEHWLGSSQESLVIAALTQGPAQVLGVPIMELQEGQPVDFTVYDPQHPWTVQKETFAGAVWNSPLLGAQLPGSVVGAYTQGLWRPVYDV